MAASAAALQLCNPSRQPPCLTSCVMASKISGGAMACPGKTWQDTGSWLADRRKTLTAAAKAITRILVLLGIFASTCTGTLTSLRGRLDGL